MVTEIKKQQRLKKINILGLGYCCPKCGVPMERRAHKENPDKVYFFSEWDYCKPCGHLQHYEKFKIYTK